MNPGQHDELRDLHDTIQRLRFELDGLTERIDKIERRRAALLSIKPAPPDSSPAQPPTHPPTQPPLPQPPPASTSTEPSPLLSPIILEPHPKPAWQDLLRPEPAPPKEAVEFRIGKTWLNRVGALILLAGIGFFLKHAFDQGWISPLMRVCMAAATGMALIVIGEVSLRKSMKPFAVGMLGGGIAILYLAAYASYGFYQLVPVHTAFLLLSAVTALSCLIAVHAKMQSIAILALLGGFWTPIALSTGQNRQIELLTYIALLDLGLLASASIRRWTSIRPLAWLATLGMFIGWYFEYYKPDALNPTLIFLAVLFTLFHAETLIAIARRDLGLTRLLSAQITLNTTAFFASAYFLARGTYPDWMGLLCLATAAAQLLPFWLFSREDALIRTHRDILLLGGLALLALAAPIQFDRQLVPISWGVQSLITIAICRRSPRLWLRAKALLILVAGAIHLLRYEYTDAALSTHFWTAGNFFLTPLILLFLGTGAAACIGPVILLVRRSAISDDDRTLAASLLVLGSVLILGIFAAQYERYLATWTWLALALFWLALSRLSVMASWLTAAVVSATCVKFILYDAIHASHCSAWVSLGPIAFNRAVLTGMLIAAAAAIAAALLRRTLDARPATTPSKSPTSGRIVCESLIIASALIVLVTGIFEISRALRFEYEHLPFPNPPLARPALLSIWYSLNAAACWLLFRTKHPARAAYSLILTLFLVAKCLLGDTLYFALTGRWSDLSGLASNRQFLAGLLVIAAVLTARAIVRRAIKSDRPLFNYPALKTILLLIVAILSVWLPSFELIRAFKFEPFAADFRDPRLAMHLALSLLWSLAAIAWLAWGFIRFLAPLRYFSIALFALTLAKVLITDLAHLEMIYRIISFVALGLLLLLASFLYQLLSARVLRRTAA